MNVLLVEDDRRISALLTKSLREEGYHVEVCYRGDEALDLIAGELYDIAVLDVMLPGMSGFDVLKHARAKHPSLPILLLTARDTMQDIVRGLDLGGDDYLTKPFSLEIFLARLRAVSRRGEVSRQPSLQVGDLVLDRNSRAVQRDGAPIVLTKKEYALLALLMRRVDQVVSRTQLIDAGWGCHTEVSDNSLDVYMHSLRLKIDGNQPFRMLRTVRALGYILAAGK